MTSTTRSLSEKCQLIRFWKKSTYTACFIILHSPSTSTTMKRWLRLWFKISLSITSRGGKISNKVLEPSLFRMTSGTSISGQRWWKIAFSFQTPMIKPTTSKTWSHPSQYTWTRHQNPSMLITNSSPKLVPWYLKQRKLEIFKLVQICIKVRLY